MRRSPSPPRLATINRSDAESPFSSTTTASPFIARQRRNGRQQRYGTDDKNSDSSHDSPRRACMRRRRHGIDDNVSVSSYNSASSYNSSSSAGTYSASGCSKTVPPLGLVSVENKPCHDSAYNCLLATNGTAPFPYVPYQEEGLRLEHICAQSGYNLYSCEELRLADYLLGRSIHQKVRAGVGLDKDQLGANQLGLSSFTATRNTGLNSMCGWAGGTSRIGLPHGNNAAHASSDTAAGVACPGTRSVSFLPSVIDHYPPVSGLRLLAHHISFIKVLENWSVEELRLADYTKTCELGLLAAMEPSGRLGRSCRFNSEMKSGLLASAHN